MAKRLYEVKPEVVEEKEVLVSDDVQYEVDRRTKAPILNPETMTPQVKALGTQTTTTIRSTRLEYPSFQGLNRRILWGHADGRQVWLVEAHPALHALLGNDKRARWIGWEEANRLVGGTLVEFILPGEAEEPKG